MSSAKFLLRAAYLATSLSFAALSPAFAQGSSFSFGSSSDSSAPIQMDSDTLSVSQTDGSAVFEGNVHIAQNDMKLSAARVQVIYDQDGKQIRRLEATGGVTLVSGTDAAEAQRADYNVADGDIVMQGDVLLVRGQNTIASQTMHIDLATGTARMEGRVRTVLQGGKE